jgi:signal transduction histidine kinase
MEGGRIADNMLTLVLLGMTGTILLACSVIFFYLRYQKRFLLQREQMQQAELNHREHLLHTVIQSQEEERIRISRDLHDHIGSTLSNLRLSVNNIQKLGEHMPDLHDATEKYKSGIDSIISDVRNISHSLFPPALSLWGFMETLEDLCLHVQGSAGLKISLKDETGSKMKCIDFDTSLALYRVVQELLNNTLKHAQARQVDIIIYPQDENVRLEYTDDGIGAQMSSERRKGIGMYSIESRLQMIKSDYTINTSPGHGFNIAVTVPGWHFKNPEA